VGDIVLKVVKTTEANADSLRAIIDQAYGYPSRPARTLGNTALPAKVPATWDGTGATPPGWTKTQVDVFRASASDAWLQLGDTEMARVAQSSVSGPNKASVASAGASAIDEPDPTEGGTRLPKP
jgi:hypothetical protein